MNDDIQDYEGDLIEINAQDDDPSIANLVMREYPQWLNEFVPEIDQFETDGPFDKVLGAMFEFLFENSALDRTNTAVQYVEKHGIELITDTGAAKFRIMFKYDGTADYATFPNQTLLKANTDEILLVNRSKI